MSHFFLLPEGTPDSENLRKLLHFALRVDSFLLAALPEGTPATEIGDFIEDFDDDVPNNASTLDTVRGYLAANASDIATRWAVLGCLYHLGCFEELDQSLEDDDDDPYGRDPAAGEVFREEFAAIAGLRDPQQLTALGEIRWEIVNSCVAQAFARVERLYARLDELEPDERGQNDAIRGQFYFLRSQPRYGLWDLEPWLPILFEPSSTQALQLARWAVDPQEPFADSDATRLSLRDAAHCFQRSLDQGFDLPSYHRAVLARCLFETEDYARAAKHYRSVLALGSSSPMRTSPARSSTRSASAVTMWRGSGRTPLVRLISLPGPLRDEE